MHIIIIIKSRKGSLKDYSGIYISIELKIVYSSELREDNANGKKIDKTKRKEKKNG